MPVRNRAARSKRADEQQKRALQDITETVTKPGATPRRTIDYPSSLPPSSPLPASTPSRIVSSDAEGETDEDDENIPILPFKLGEHSPTNPSADERENPFLDSAFSTVPVEEETRIPESDPADIDMTLSDPFGFVAVERKVKAQRGEKPRSKAESAQPQVVQRPSTPLSALTPSVADSPGAGPSTSAKRTRSGVEGDNEDNLRSSSPSPPPPKRPRRTTRKQATTESSEPVKKRSLPRRNASKKKKVKEVDESEKEGSEEEIEAELMKPVPKSSSSPTKKASTSKLRRKTKKEVSESESEGRSAEEEPPRRVTRSSTANKKKPPSSHTRKKNSSNTKKEEPTKAVTATRHTERKVSDKTKPKAKEMDQDSGSESDGREKQARRRQERIEYFKRLDRYKMHQENVYIV